MRNIKELYEKHNNIIEVTAVTAMPLSERLRDKLVAKLEAVSGAKIVLVEKVDKSLMGGIVLRYSEPRSTQPTKSCSKFIAMPYVPLENSRSSPDIHLSSP